MKLIIFGATGDIGQKAVAEALRRGHEVMAVARSTKRLAALEGSITRVAHDIANNPDHVRHLMATQDAAISVLRQPPGMRQNLSC